MRTLKVFLAALNNVETTEGVTEAMADLGYGPEALSEGKRLVEETRQAFASSINKKDVRVHYYDDFAEKKEDLEKMYESHRMRARLVYRNNKARGQLLAVTGVLPRTYDVWIETVRKFYTEVSNDQAIQDELSRTKITPEDITAGLAKIEEVEAAWTEHLKYKGISQNSTMVKNNAFVALKKWMKGFYIAAKIGLKHEPQLLEALGKVVRS